MVRVGGQVPEMTLEAYHNGEIKKVKLSDYKGRWVVLLFYPGDFTFVCPTELEEAADHYEEFHRLGCEVLSVSTDTVYVHKAWHDTSPAVKKVQFPMIADPTRRLCQEFGTYLEESGVSLRATFIIDPDGVIRSVEIHDLNIGRSIEEILRKLQAALYVREHKGEVCPASWKPGKKTLKPNLDLVGRI